MRLTKHADNNKREHNGAIGVQRHSIAPDYLKLVHLQIHALQLGLAWHFTRDARYSSRLVEKIRAFYLDETTGMLPSLKYAQLKPGFPAGAHTVRLSWPLHATF
jgi:Alginate lyase